MIAEFVAERTGLQPDMLLPRTVAHAMLGVAVAAYEQWLESGDGDLCDLLDTAVLELGSAWTLTS